jgi:MFS family permease
MSAGSFVGALAAGSLCDRIGRKKSIQVATVIWIIGSMVTCSSQNVAQLIAGRVINRISVGIKYTNPIRMDFG